MRNKKGYVLVIVLLILAVTTALVIDFSGTVYGYVNAANNFNESERMSLLLKSAYLLASEKALDLSQVMGAQREISFEEKIEDTTVSLNLEDNNSKFNVNTLVSRINGEPNLTAYFIFRRLLKELKINEEYADRLVDYIDPDKIPEVPGGENNAKNNFLFSLSELGYIFPEDDLNKVRPYLTIFGETITDMTYINININTADLPLLKALHKDMTETLAKGIIEVREGKPFGSTDEVRRRVPGMETIGPDIAVNIIKVESNSFNVVIKAERNDLVETVEAGFDLSGSRIVTKYWRER
jgi:type II secretory pathway component PulK